MKLPAIVRLHLIVFMWGFTGVMGKLITLQAIPLVWGRILIAAALIFTYVRFFSQETLQVSKKTLFKLLGCGMVIGIHWMLFYGSIKVSNISIATSTLSTGTLFVAFIEPIIYKRRIRISEIILGLIIIFCITLIFKTEFKYWLGILLGIGCSFLSALFSVFNGKMYGKAGSSVIIFYEMLGGFIILNLFMLLTNEWGAISNIKLTDVVYLIILGGLLTGLPMIMTMKLMKEITPFTLMLSVNMEPVYAIIIAFLIWEDSEQMSPVFYLATIIMIAAICVNGYLKTKKKII